MKCRLTRYPASGPTRAAMSIEPVQAATVASMFTCKKESGAVVVFPLDSTMATASEGPQPESCKAMARIASSERFGKTLGSSFRAISPARAAWAGWGIIQHSRSDISWDFRIAGHAGTTSAVWAPSTDNGRTITLFIICVCTHAY